jgi:hypothetical protein
VNIAGHHLPFDFDGEFQPGDFEFHAVTQDGVTGEYLLYGCPLQKRSMCGVPLKPLANPPYNTGWTFDGNRDAPTLSPSVNCVGGCKWHGWIRAGTWSDA